MDDQELLARIKHKIELIENQITNEEAPTEIKQFARHCLSLALANLNTFSMFERTLWTADHIIRLKNEAQATTILKDKVFIIDDQESKEGD